MLINDHALMIIRFQHLEAIVPHVRVHTYTLKFVPLLYLYDTTACETRHKRLDNG